MASLGAFHPREHDVTHKTFRMALSRAVVAAAFAALATTAQAVFVSGSFDPPDLSGTHTFELEGPCLDGTGQRSVNGDTNCTVTLTRLTVLLDNSFSLDFSESLSFSGINSILVVDGQVAGVNSDVIGPAAGGGDFPGPWWIQYRLDPDPVDLLRGEDCASQSPSVCTVVDTAFVVTFFASDANGNPIDGNGNRIPEPGSLLLIVAALGAGWLARRRAAA